eukprot:SAG31_NODE_2780_length_5098_cov_2.124000_7_plen_65_part_00
MVAGMVAGVLQSPELGEGDLLCQQASFTTGQLCTCADIGLQPFDAVGVLPCARHPQQHVRHDGH